MVALDSLMLLSGRQTPGVPTPVIEVDVAAGSWAARHRLSREEWAGAAAGFALDLPLRQLARLAGVPLATAHRLSLTFRTAIAARDPNWREVIGRIVAESEPITDFVVRADGTVAPGRALGPVEQFAGLTLTAESGGERALRRLRFRLRRYRGLATRLAPLYLKECELRARLPWADLLKVLLESLSQPALD